MPRAHASHQIGLDADIWFFDLPARSRVTAQMRENLHVQTVLNRSFKSLNKKRWKTAYESELLWFSEQPEVERLFVNAAIKQTLCEKYPGDTRLIKLRPWMGHDDHFHVRLKCPRETPGCVAQEAPGEIECEPKFFTTWLSDEVIYKWRHPKPHGKAETAALPLPCRDVVAQNLSLPQQ